MNKAIDSGRAAALAGNLPRLREGYPIPLSFRENGLEGEMPVFEVKSDITDDSVRHVELEGVRADGLTVRAEYNEYIDFPAVEWLAFLENRGATPTSVISEARIGGCVLPLHTPVLQYSNGDTRTEEGFARLVRRVEEKTVIEPFGGTSCYDAFPYMRLCGEDACVSIAVGWPGHWFAEFTPAEGGTAVSFGQRHFAMRIQPGEVIRLPRVTMMITAGDEAYSRNQWRRWFIRHILVRERGEPLPPKLCMHWHQEGGKPEHTGATEQGQLRAIRTYHERGLHPDIWWIDAGWYPCNYEWGRLGDWQVDTERFPRGLAPVGEACRDYGMQLLLWFEPERARPETEISRTHPEWMLRESDESTQYLVDLGNDECCSWLIERIDSIIKASGVNIYRQDFNYFKAPEHLWLKKDGEGRIGAAENHHMQNYLRLWDTLRERNPGLWVDSCASGGRRNDLESMRRGVPLHYTDVGYGNHPIKQKQHRLMFEWIPYFRAHNMAWDRPDGTYGRTMEPSRDFDEFSFHAAMAPSLTSMLLFDADERDYGAARLMHPIWRRAAELMLRGDYYPLTECPGTPDVWYAMHFDDPVRGDGFVQVLRNIAAEAEAYELRLTLPDVAAEYRFTDAVSGESFVMSGTQAAAGRTIRIPKRSAVLYFYEKLN